MAEHPTSRFVRRALATVLICFGSALALVVLVAASFEPDFRPLSPVDGSTNVHAARILKVRIGNAAELQDIDVSLRKNGKDDEPVPVVYEIDPSEKLISIKPRQLLAPSTQYRLCLSHASKQFLSAAILGERKSRIDCATFTTRPAPESPSLEGELPVLIVEGNDSPYASYYAEILKAEGLNLFHTVPEDHFDPAILGRYSLLILAGSALPPQKVHAIERWVRSGGSLVAIRPNSDLLALMCLKQEGSLRRTGYIKANPKLALSQAFAAHALQVHGDIDQLATMPACAPSVQDANEVASVQLAGLYETPDKPLGTSAIAMRRVGSGTMTVFAFDLAQSIALTRQGNPDWADQDRDGVSPRRPNDLFYPDFLDINLIGVPQADELQRLLVNIMVGTAQQPLPRFWYLPRGLRAAIVMVGDDHATPDGTATLLAKMTAESSPNCILDRWECLRATAFLTPETDIPAELVRTYSDLGFEFGVHTDTDCKNQDAHSLKQTFVQQMRLFRKKYPFLGQQLTQRIHCIAWNGWTDTAQTQRSVGVRFDMNYYNWPPDWLGGRAGFMTGSCLPMPFVTEDGAVLDIYQAATQLVNEDQVPHRKGVSTMIGRALGRDQFFGAFVTHYDYSDDYAEVLMDLAKRSGVPLISAAQMLSWVDARNRSRFTDLRWKDGILRFTQRLAPEAVQAQVLLPMTTSAGRLSAIRCDGRTLPFVVEEIKHLEAASFPAKNGTCDAIYGVATTGAVQ